MREFTSMSQRYTREVISKIQAIAKYHNYTLSSSCAAIVTTLFNDFEWLQIPCDLELQGSYFVCERTIQIYASYKHKYIRNILACDESYIFIGETCWKIKQLSNLLGNHYTPVNNANVNIFEPLLNVWSFGRSDRKDVVVKQSSSSDIKTCISTIDLAFQRIKNWDIMRCSHLRVKVALVHMIVVNYTQDCDIPRQFACDNGECISSIYLCDGRNDCLDNSDELLCTANNSNIQRAIIFHCLSGKYIYIYIYIYICINIYISILSTIRRTYTN